METLTLSIYDTKHDANSIIPMLKRDGVLPVNEYRLHVNNALDK